jgi:hypothetical protein
MLAMAMISTTIGVAAAPVGAQQPTQPQESPWAMRAPATPAPASASSQSQSAVAAAKIEAPKITPEQRALAGKMVAAIQAKDLAKMKDLVAPTSRACFNKDTQPYLDELLKKEMRFVPSKVYQARITGVPPMVSRTSKYVNFPIAASQVLEIEFSEPDGTSITLNRMIAQENGRWYEIAPCPTPAGMDRFHHFQQVQMASRERAKKIYPQVKEPLKGQVRALVAKRDNADAWKLCMQSLHVDFHTARELVSMIAGESTD